MHSIVYSDDNPQVTLVQPVDSHDMEEMNNEIDYIRSHSKVPFRLIAVHIKKWNEELTPWPAPPVFGKIPFGEGAKKTLEDILKIIKTEPTNSFQSPEVSKDVLRDFSSSSLEMGRGAALKPCYILGGYSLAGLFSLWSGTQYPFDGIVAASPSVWYKDWLSYSESHPMKSSHVYLSLGDKEHRSKTAIMATVNDCIHRQLDILQSQGVDSILEMNPGNHFQDNGIRTGKGFVWVMERL